MEASSHGLDQFRLDGVEVSAAAFTNLTRDHLDYHLTMDAYLTAKLRLFTELLPAGGAAIINADIAAERADHRRRRRRAINRVITFGRKNGRSPDPQPAAAGHRPATVALRLRQAL